MSLLLLGRLGDGQQAESWPYWQQLFTIFNCSLVIYTIVRFGPVVPLAVFLTGSDRIPIHGMESLRIVIQSTTAEEHYLPVAHTCYNLLDMPRYQTKEILRCRLTQAVEQYEGFSLVWGGEPCPRLRAL